MSTSQVVVVADANANTVWVSLRGVMKLFLEQFVSNTVDKH